MATEKKDFDKLTESGKYRALTAAEIRADKWQREAEKLRQLFDHWKGVFLLAFEIAPQELFDEGHARRIKRETRKV